MNKITTKLPKETLVRSHLGVSMLGVMDAQDWCAVEENAKLVADPEMTFEKFADIVEQVMVEKQAEAHSLYQMTYIGSGPGWFPGEIYRLQFTNYIAAWFQDLMARAAMAEHRGRIQLIDPSSNGGLPPGPGFDPFR